MAKKLECVECFEKHKEEDMMFCHSCGEPYCMSCGGSELLTQCHSCLGNICPDCGLMCKYEEFICRKCINDDDTCLKATLGDCDRMWEEEWEKEDDFDDL